MRTAVDNTRVTCIHVETRERGGYLGTQRCIYCTVVMYVYMCVMTEYNTDYILHCRVSIIAALYHALIQ